MEILNAVSIVIAGLMVGNELAIAAFVHPTLDRLPDDVHLPASIALARLLGMFMPFWYALVRAKGRPMRSEFEFRLERRPILMWVIIFSTNALVFTRSRHVQSELILRLAGADPAVSKQQGRANAAPAKPISMPVIEGGARFLVR